MCGIAGILWAAAEDAPAAADAKAAVHQRGNDLAQHDEDVVEYNKGASDLGGSDLG